MAYVLSNTYATFEAHYEKVKHTEAELKKIFTFKKRVIFIFSNSRHIGSHNNTIKNIPY